MIGNSPFVLASKQDAQIAHRQQVGLPVPEVMPAPKTYPAEKGSARRAIRKTMNNKAKIHAEVLATARITPDYSLLLASANAEVRRLTDALGQCRAAYAAVVENCRRHT